MVFYTLDLKFYLKNGQINKRRLHLSKEEKQNKNKTVLT